MAKQVGNGAPVCCVFVFILLVMILQLYTDVEPYMDEIYHYPQGLAYCHNKFHIWDPKITTFPGLYIISYIFKSIVMLPLMALGISDKNNYISCSIMYYRGYNIVLAALSLVLYVECRQNLNPSLDMKIQNWLISIILFLYPLNFFYYFIYYTDTTSTFFLLLVYYLSIKRRREYQIVKESRVKFIVMSIATFVAAIMAVLMRQTNAIWILFIAGTIVIDDLKRSDNYQDTWSNFNVKGFFELLSMFFRNMKQLIYYSMPLLLPVLSFIIFICYNGSIVLGDKENHEISIHFAMPLHMLFIASCILYPSDIFNEFKGIVHNGFKITLPSLIGFCIVLYMLYYGSYDHPFLLSDNRHYMFYIWKRILSHKIIRILLVPIYYTVIKLCLVKIASSKGPMWVLMYLICVLFNLVPARLLEPRYFTPGIIIMSLNSSNSGIYQFKKIKLNNLFFTSYFILIVIFVLFNAVSIKIFVYDVFQSDDGRIARFMY